MILNTLEVHSNLWIYRFTIELFFQASLLIRIFILTKIPRDEGLLSKPTTEVNGNDP